MSNRVLGRKGESFWQHEPYDHWVRGQRQFERIARYIEDNLVPAGLCASPEDYRFSSAYAGEDARRGRRHGEPGGSLYRAWCMTKA
jgi:hypothetical protein